LNLHIVCKAGRTSLGRKAKARELIRASLLRGARGWTQLLKETGLAKGALSTNLRQMQKDKEVVYEIKGPRRSKHYMLSDRGIVRASIATLSKGMAAQIGHVLERIGRTNPSQVKNWAEGQQELDFEINEPNLGKVKLTLHPNKRSG
jgi:hypothetical protein